ncbi:MAG TPA: hypothetical protein VGB82_23340 [Alphaproteobacteria bacterium]
MLLRGIDDGLLLSPMDIAVSIYVPIDLTETDLRAPEDHLRQRFTAADEALQARGVDKRRRDAVLAPARRAVADIDLRQHRAPSLVVFASENYGEVFAWPIAVPEITVVGHRFYIVPLLPPINAGGSFFTLALSANGARLLECDEYGWIDRTPPHLPRAPDVVAETDYQPTTEGSPVARHRRYTGAATGAHSYESPDELRKAELIEYLHRLSSALEAHLHGDRRPIILVADPDIGGHFRKLSGLRQLNEQAVDLNPNGLTDHELVAAARTVWRPPEQAVVAEFVDLVNARLGRADPRVGIRVEDIVAGAHYSRVDAVMVAADKTVWGRFDEAEGTVVAHEAPAGDDDELLNDIVAETLLKGGRAFSAPWQNVPRQSVAVATFRY